MTKTCGNCGFFDTTGHGGGGNESRVGNCLAEPPMPFIGQAPPSVLQRPGQPAMPATFGVERVTRANRPQCRHWKERPHG
jgi:hypothetical protein